MADSLKIAVIGDFNFAFNAHHATNLALEHTADFLEIEINYYWVRISEAASWKANHLKGFDGFWIAPDNQINNFYIKGILNLLTHNECAVFITGDGFKAMLELLIDRFQLNPNQEKLISDNLVDTNQFNVVQVLPSSANAKKIFLSDYRKELTLNRYALYPQLLSYLKDNLIDIEALNEFNDPEVISLKNNDFVLASMHLPQICSTREMPSPLVSAFINYAHQVQNV